MTGLPDEMAYNLLSDAMRLDPGTLSGRTKVRSVAKLYAHFRNELEQLCADMVPHRERMIQAGYGADFSDREAELLYLMVRSTRPSTVVEISPNHGYSTNYILAALTENGHGTLQTYEIQKAVGEKPIESVIRENQLPKNEQNRLVVNVGDARSAVIPAPDFLFIDSLHESHFASWYLAELVPKAKLCFVHDILIQSRNGSLIPKAPFHGPREAAYLLEALHLNGQDIAAVAELADLDAAKSVPIRYAGGAERSIIFNGHNQSDLATKLHREEQQLSERLCPAIMGERAATIDFVRKLVKSSPCGYSNIRAIAMLSLLGYRWADLTSEFSDILPYLYANDMYFPFTISKYLALMDLGSKMKSPKIFARADYLSYKSNINRISKADIYSNYRSDAMELPLKIAKVANKARSLMSKVRL